MNFQQRPADTAFAERSGAGGGAKARSPQTADFVGNESARRAVNPFISNHYHGLDMQAVSVDDRLERLKSFSAAQCIAALRLEHVQDTVRKALARRARSLGVRACRKCGCSKCDPCPAGCAWASLDLCTRCAPTARNREGGDGI